VAARTARGAKVVQLSSREINLVDAPCDHLVLKG